VVHARHHSGVLNGQDQQLAKILDLPHAKLARSLTIKTKHIDQFMAESRNLPTPAARVADIMLAEILSKTPRLKTLHLHQDWKLAEFAECDLSKALLRRITQSPLPKLELLDLDKVTINGKALRTALRAYSRTLRQLVLKRS